MKTLHTPTQEDVLRAKELLDRLKAKARHTKITMCLDDQAVPLTPRMVDLLNTLLDLLAQGQPVTVMPLEAELTTQEAANLLGVSRPHLIKLLEQGRIPYRKVGTHRRVRVQDVLAYQERTRREQEAALNALQAQAQELNMGY